MAERASFALTSGYVGAAETIATRADTSNVDNCILKSCGLKMIEVIGFGDVSISS